MQGAIGHGRLVAEGTRRELVDLVGEYDHVRLSLDSDHQAAADQLQGLPGVHSINATDHTLDLGLSEAHRALPSILSAASDPGARVLSVEVVEPDLEAVFMHLTGRTLRD